MVGSIDGIVSGMDTGSIIKQLMQIERMPQFRLQSQKAGLEKVLAAYRGLNTKFSAMGDVTKAMTAATGWQLTKALSSDPTRLGVTATAGSVTGSFAFTVKSLAAAAATISSGSVSSTATAVADGPILLAKGAAAIGFSSFDQGNVLAPGAHTVTVTQSSAAAAKAGATALGSSTTITAGSNDTLSVSVNGTLRTVTLAAGTYDPAALATEVGRAAGADVTASVGSDGTLRLATTNEGSAASLQVGGGTALAALGLTTDAAALRGVDGLVRLDGDATREVRVTDVRAGGQITLSHSIGDSVVATLAGGLRAGDATAHQVDLANGATLAQVVDGINKAGAGVTAAAVQVSTGTYRLQLTSTTTGAASSIGLDPDAFPTALSGLGTLQTLTAGSDAVLTVGTGAGAYDVTRSTNTVTDLLKGVTLTLAKADPTALVNVDISTDAAGVSAQVGKMVEAVNAALAEITSLTRYDAATKKGGLLVGDGLLRRLRTDLIAAVTQPVAGSPLGAIAKAGIELQRDGTIKFDPAKFSAAYAADPAAVEALLGKGSESAPGVAARIAAHVKQVTDRSTGLVPGAIKSKESQIRGFSERISSWDNRLTLRETALRRQFTAMEKALGAAQSQGQWLAGQIAGLPTWG